MAQTICSRCSQPYDGVSVHGPGHCEKPGALKAALDEAEEELAAVYRKLWPLREAYAEAVPPAELPPPRYRTAKQDLIARCPRCGGQLESEGAAQS